VLDFLKAHEDLNSGIAQVSAGNNRKVPVAILSHTTSSTKPTVSRNNGKIFDVLGAQGDLDSRLRELVHHPKVASVAVSELYVPCNLDAKATVDFKAHFSLTKTQVGAIRGLGVNLATEEEIRVEEKSRELLLEHLTVELEISKPRPREVTRTITVRGPSEFTCNQIQNNVSM